MSAPLVLLQGCNDSGCLPSEVCAESADPLLDIPETYEFKSRFDAESSVSYSGQVLRHVLIADLTGYIGGLHDSIESGFDTGSDAVLANLNAFYEFDSGQSGDIAIKLSPSGFELSQSAYDDIASGKNLRGKLAGMDGGDRYYRDFSEEFGGWSDDSLAAFGGNIESPDGFVQAIFTRLNANALEQELSGPTREVSDGQGGTFRVKTHQTVSGLDLQQLAQKFLLGAITFSQGADDYLDEGLESDNSKPEEGKNFTALEHAWDEGFGYFGAARAYLLQSDDDIADGQVVDSDGDGTIDLTREYNFGASTNAAKRDRGSSSGTDFTRDAMLGFLRGRALITAVSGPLNDAQQDELASARDAAIGGWEKALSATVVHYVNEVVEDYARLGTDDYSFSDHAKHWSELKGFALTLQFAPTSPLSTSQFSALHRLLGDAPLLGDADAGDLSDYVESLLEVRGILEEAYAFTAGDVEGW